MSAAYDRRLSWRKSCACTNGDCLEIARSGDAVLVRNSRTPSVVLRFPLTAWQDFTTAVAIRQGARDQVGMAPEEAGTAMRVRAQMWLQ